MWRLALGAILLVGNGGVATPDHGDAARGGGRSHGVHELLGA